MSAGALYYGSIPIILWVQQMLRPFQGLLFTATDVADPGYVVCILFPVCYCLKPCFGRRILWGIIISEWLNLNLKWFLHDDRPYWWVMETRAYNETLFRHYPTTCETGPGSPSGHAMAIASTGFIFCYRGLKELGKLIHLTRFQESAISFLVWFLYAMVLIAIDVSRIYIATHFPHQVLLGNVLGVLTGYAVAKFPVNRFTFRQYMTSLTVIALSTMATYYLLLYYAFDPNWSVMMAKKWCSNVEWVKITTTPFHTLVRVTGALFGLGLGVGLTDYILDTSQTISFSSNVKLYCTPFATIFAWMLEQVPVPREDMTIFYVMSFFKICAVAFVVSGLLPNVFSALLDDDYTAVHTSEIINTGTNEKECFVNGSLKMRNGTGHVANDSIKFVNGSKQIMNGTVHYHSADQKCVTNDYKSTKLVQRKID